MKKIKIEEETRRALNYLEQKTVQHLQPTFVKKREIKLKKNIKRKTKIRKKKKKEKKKKKKEKLKLAKNMSKKQIKTCFTNTISASCFFYTFGIFSYFNINIPTYIPNALFIPTN
jgi:hypothetical protein